MCNLYLVLAIPFSDAFQFLWVFYQNLYTELESCLLKAEVQTSDLRVSDPFWHLLGGYSAVEGVSVYSNCLLSTLTMCFQNIDCLDWEPKTETPSEGHTLQS